MAFMCPDCDDVELEFVTPETSASGHFECPECGAAFTEDELTDEAEMEFEDDWDDETDEDESNDVTSNDDEEW